MNRNILLAVGIFVGVFLLGFTRSISTIFGLLLIACGALCYSLDKNDKSFKRRAMAFKNNSNLFVGGAILTLFSLLTSGNATTVLASLFQVLTYAFSVTTAPILIWHHLCQRKYLIAKARANQSIQIAPRPFKAFCIETTPAQNTVVKKRCSSKQVTEKQMKLAV